MEWGIFTIMIVVNLGGVVFYWVFKIKILASRLQHAALYSSGFYIYSDMF